jgi:hypothetical protein
MTDDPPESLMAVCFVNSFGRSARHEKFVLTSRKRLSVFQVQLHAAAVFEALRSLQRCTMSIITFGIDQTLGDCNPRTGLKLPSLGEH